MSSSGRRLHLPTVMMDFHGRQADSVTSNSHVRLATTIHRCATVCQSYFFGRTNSCSLIWITVSASGSIFNPGTVVTLPIQKARMSLSVSGPVTIFFEIVGLDIV